MQEQQGSCVWRGGLGVCKVHVDGAEAINFYLGLELRDLVQLGFLGSPVIAFPPEIDSFAHHLHCDTIVLAPLVIGICSGKAGEFELLPEELELRVWNIDL